MNRIILIVFSVFAVFAVSFPMAVLAQDAPQWYCAGVEPWIISAGDLMPDDAPCGNNTGSYLVDSEAGMNQYFYWSQARARLTDRDRTLWFVPQLKRHPAFFCTGGDAWEVPLNALVSEDPVCASGSGEYVVDLNGGLIRTDDWGQVRDMLWGHEATVFFERVMQEPAEGFCEGAVPWSVPGNNLLPQASVCPAGSGTYVVDVEENLRKSDSWGSARLYMGSSAGTFWFEPKEIIL